MKFQSIFFTKMLLKLAKNRFVLTDIFRSFASYPFMKIFITVLFSLIFMICHAGSSLPHGSRSKSDTVPAVHKPLFKHKHEQASSPLIEKMSDEQLMLLIDHMFEASYMPPDLWSQVM